MEKERAMEGRLIGKMEISKEKEGEMDQEREWA